MCSYYELYDSYYKFTYDEPPCQIARGSSKRARKTRGAHSHSFVAPTQQNLFLISLLLFTLYAIHTSITYYYRKIPVKICTYVCTSFHSFSVR